MMTRLLFFAGSARKESLNKKLAKLAANMAQDAGAQVTHIDLKDFETPLYDGDIEAQSGIPKNAKNSNSFLQNTMVSSLPHQNIIVPCHLF